MSDGISVLWHPKELRPKAKKKSKGLMELLSVMKCQVKNRECLMLTKAHGRAGGLLGLSQNAHGQRPHLGLKGRILKKKKKERKPSSLDYFL